MQKLDDVLEVIMGGGPKLRTIYRLIEDYQPYDGIVIPEGFVTDLASIPKILDNLLGLDPKGLYADAAVVHDYHYNQGAKLGTRKRADRLFRKHMKFDGVGFVLRNVMYYLVRAFGRKRYIK